MRVTPYQVFIVWEILYSSLWGKYKIHSDYLYIWVMSTLQRLRPSDLHSFHSVILELQTNFLNKKKQKEAVKSKTQTQNKTKKVFSLGPLD